jgi:phosphohistidine phosphatase
LGLNPARAKQKNLWLIRHSEAKDASSNSLDIERDLTTKGHSDSLNMRAWLNQLAQKPDWFWASAATRTVRTAQLAMEKTEAELVIDPSLYLATAETILDILRSSPEDISCVAVVAHNPGISDLANRLSSTEEFNYLPPSGIAYLQLNCEWSELTTSNQYDVEVTLPSSSQSIPEQQP